MTMQLIFTIGFTLILLQLLRNSLADTLKGGTGNPEDFFTYFINEAPLYPANHDKNFTGNIPWADANLLKISQGFHRRNYLSFSIMLFDTIMQSIAIKTMSSVVQCTRSFENVLISHKRVLRTFIYFRLYFESGPEILNPNSDARKALEVIRTRHKSAAYVAANRSVEALDALRDNALREFPKGMDIFPDKETHELVWAIRTDLALIDTSEAPKDIGKWDWSKPVGQFDFGIEQFFFYGMIVMNPKMYGIHSTTEEELKAYTHFWAVLGRIIGIEDRFNVALNLPNSDLPRFYRNIVIANFKHAEEKNIRQMGNMMEGMYRNFPVPTFVRFKCWLFNYLKTNLPEFEGRNIRKLMNAEDIVCLKLLQIGSSPIHLSYTFRSLTTLAFDSWLRQETERLDIKLELQ